MCIKLSQKDVFNLREKRIEILEVGHNTRQKQTHTHTSSNLCKNAFFLEKKAVIFNSWIEENIKRTKK